MRFKITGFTRFILIMIVLGPLAFIIASYYNGKDGIMEIKKLFTGESTFVSSTSQDTTEANIVLPRKSIDKAEYNKLLLINEALKDSILDKELQIRELQRNLKRCRF